MSRRPAFTLVELLVAIACIAVLISLLLPALGKTKTIAKAILCANNMRQHAVLSSMYLADCLDRIPTPGSPHTSGTQGGWSTACIGLITPKQPGVTCPSIGVANSGRLWPSGFGWYYYMGYIQPQTRLGKLGILDCPAAPMFIPNALYAPLGVSYPQSREYFRQDHSLMTACLAAKDLTSGVNPQGSSTDCVGTGQVGYLMRGWMRVAQQTVFPLKPAKYARDWQTDDAVEVDFEWTHATAGQMDCHDDGLNVLFFGGHVKFGGKRIAGYEPYIYYSLKGFPTPTLSQANGTAGTPANSGWVYNPTNYSYTDTLWNYYATGIP